MALLSRAQCLALAVATEALSGVDVAIVDMHCETASADVLSAIAKRYGWATANGLTGAGTPAAWVAIGKAADIAGFTLLSWRGVNSSDSTYAIVKDRHDAARKWLADLITGDVELPGVDPERGGPLVKSGRGPRWTRDALLGGDVTPYYPPGIDLGDGES